MEPQAAARAVSPASGAPFTPSRQIVMHYPSVPTAYYATGQWTTPNQTQKQELRQNSVFVIYEATKEVLLKGKYPSNDPRIFFRAVPPDPQENQLPPTLIKGQYWKYADIPSNSQILRRLTQITNNSGKFLVFVSLSKLDELWKVFTKAYEENKLGYGLHCSTGKESPIASDNDSVIAVFSEDAFDSREVARIAWEIDKLLGNWKGVLNYMTDRTTKAKSGQNCINENGMLYSISSYSFIQNARQGGTAKEPCDNFVSKFQNRFYDAAKNRQAALQMKSYKTI